MKQRRLPIFLLVLAAPLALLTTSFALVRDGGRLSVGAVVAGPGAKALAPGPSAVNKPGILLTKTVGTNPSRCATTDAVTVPAGANVTYCFQVLNTGDVPFDTHDLSDDQLGQLLTGFPYTLAPGTTIWVTATASVNKATVNIGSWTARNSSTRDFAAASDYATVNIVKPAAFPVCEGFEGGSLPSSFYAETTSAGFSDGRVAVTTGYPHSGNYGLDLDTDCATCPLDDLTTQSAVMVVDLGGQDNAYLNFWVHEHGDEDHPQDGVFISDDNGTTWVLIQSLNGFLSSYQYVGIDLASAANSVGMSLVDGFRIKFQSTDNFPIASDGYSFDDICVQPHQIGLSKTVGTNPHVCATEDDIEITVPTEVTYCFKATNLGDLSIGLHNLADSELGSILSGTAFTLPPGALVFITQTATISATTINTATWTAYNAGMVDQVSASDAATVRLVHPLYLPVILRP